MDKMDFGIRENVIEKCRQALEMADELLVNEKKHVVVRKLAQNAKDRLKVIEEICGVEKYKLCFIGDVGIGKSTAISHLTGLVDDAEASMPVMMKFISRK